MNLSRRSILGGLLAAPAIVKIQSLMILPRRPWPPLIYRDGLLLCNGAQVRTADYPDLFRVMGDAYGGNGVDNFRLPMMEPMPFLDATRVLGHAINVKPENGPIGMIVFV